MSSHRLILAAILIVALPILSPTLARAIDTGDIVGVDYVYGLFFVEHSTGHEHRFQPIYRVGELTDVTTDANGNIYTLDALGIVYKVDATSGAPTIVTSGPFIQYSHTIDVAPDGSLLVAVDASNGGVEKIDPTSGSHTRVFNGETNSLTVSATGVVHILLADGYIYRLDVATGDTVRVSDRPFYGLDRLATEADGNLIVTERDSRRVARVLLGAGGSVQIVSQGGLLNQPDGVTVEMDGTIVVWDTQNLPGCSRPGGPDSCVGMFYKIDPLSGAQSIFNQISFWRTGGIEIYRGPHADTPARGVTWGQIKTIYR